MQEFSIGSDSDSGPLIEMYVLETEICVPKMGTVPIWERESESVETCSA